MAEKGFGVKEVNLIGASGTPTITSPNNLNLNADNVAISTNVSICLLYTSPSPRDMRRSRMPSSA